MKTTFILFVLFIVNPFFPTTSLMAQIVYTDIIPDTTLTPANPSYGLDLNNDSIDDFTISYASVQVTLHCSPCGHTATRANTTYSCESLNNNTIGFNDSALILNQQIDFGSPWSSGIQQLLYITSGMLHCWGPGCVGGFVESGPWAHATDKYLALQIESGGNTYYGWIRMTKSTTLLIKDYAFNSTPDQSILAGETGINSVELLNDNPEPGLIFFPNPVADFVTLVFRSSDVNEINILNSLGQSVYSATALADKMQVDVRGFAEGLYLVNWRTEGRVERRRLMVLR